MIESTELSHLLASVDIANRKYGNEIFQKVLLPKYLELALLLTTGPFAFDNILGEIAKHQESDWRDFLYNCDKFKE